MAYGMQLPQVQFPYFYPTKIPTPIPATSSTNSTPSYTSSLANDQPKQHHHSSTSPVYTKLSSPINFSKRENDSKSSDNGSIVEQSSSIHQSERDSPLQRKHSMSDDHKAYSISSDQEFQDENENVEIE